MTEKTQAEKLAILRRGLAAALTIAKSLEPATTEESHHKKEIVQNLIKASSASINYQRTAERNSDG